ncbi:hypothetical protein HN807_00085 [Candidatus Bathyarchaeota archaeon]|jgi:uncharacterized repeat protein (TIGR04076 family)|nr:hypothetical protein [Candidatus Bathyarchaeota archaeon]MBT4319279.1 hypothetical protein [Candidatus Bathyarchaeota archaeon]MBT4422891.1 hypothetical protein [Candidatus Bathyarchaeota archaeon]MBT5643445.1 hypothetical protein [Candidatus Bathyarchaeota archaeon]MBT6603871.1 hypothetical protein [Candidatus Bathyarchaeota archaeon]
MTENFWETKVQITCIEKNGVCEHEIGDSYTIEYVQDYVKGLCSGIQDPARQYAGYTALGVPSWESDDKTVFRIHCISKKGTVWELRKITD